MFGLEKVEEFMDQSKISIARARARAYKQIICLTNGKKNERNPIFQYGKGS